MTFNGLPSSFFPPNFLLGNIESPHESSNHPALLAGNHLPDFQGSMAAMAGKRSMSFSAGLEGCEEMMINGSGGCEDEFSDDCSLVGEKKRRLSVDQVRTLERNFEQGSKLEPERKLRLARALGLQPRQIAIWFQNRRARWKTKQLEKDFDELKRRFETIQNENDTLQAHNKKLQVEILALKGIEMTEPINLNKETDQGSCSNRSENNSDVSRTPAVVIDSPMNNNNHHRIPSFFPSYKLANNPQLLQNPKIEQVHGEGFPTLFSAGGGGGGVDDQSAFWAWSDHQNFQSPM